MYAFYNLKHVGDVLMIQLDPTVTQVPTVEKKGNVALLSVDDKVVGLNLFEASQYFSDLEEGSNELNAERVKEINKVIQQAGLNHVITGDFSPKFVVGYVSSREKHPNADKLSVCQVEVGEETLQIVCGAANVDAGQKVVVAKVGAVMPSGLVIKDAELRGVPSSGMICSAKELGLEQTEPGILVLDESIAVGTAFKA